MLARDYPLGRTLFGFHSTPLGLGVADPAAVEAHLVDQADFEGFRNPVQKSLSNSWAIEESKANIPATMLPTTTPLSSASFAQSKKKKSGAICLTPSQKPDRQ